MNGSPTQLDGKLLSHPISIRPSKSEIECSKLSPQNLEIAIRCLHRDGLVVIEDVIRHDVLDRLNEKMVQDAFNLQARKDSSPYNYNRGNIQQDPPCVREFFDESIFLSK
jgi:hypothetical protein